MSLLKLFQRPPAPPALPDQPTVDLEEVRVRDIVRRAFSNGEYRRIYHYHIRKTAGTTINVAFLHNSQRDRRVFYEKLAQTPKRRLVAGNKVFVGWNGRLINEGFYFYAFSHAPMHQLRVPPGTFTITCLRDPAKRVISHYNMLRFYQREGIHHPCMATEGPWLGNGLDHFLDHVPKEHLLNQLYMFSSRFDVCEAASNIRSCSYVLSPRTLPSDLAALEKKLNLTLPISNEKNYNYKEEFAPATLERLHEMMQPEYDLLDALGKEDLG